MAQFSISWDNTDVNASSNSTGQQVGYRQKSVGGAWITTGFTPSNNLAKTVSSVNSPVLSANKLYEFKVDCLCTQNGPSQNDNGIIEQIGLACIVPDIVNTGSTSAIGVDLTNTDITKARFTLRKASDNSIVFGPTVAPRVGNMASVVAAGLTVATNYYWQIVLIATVNGVEINSSDAGQINSVCGPYNITTSGAPVMDLRWIPNTTVCEKEGGFSVVKTITGLSSPVKVFHDVTTGRVYVADMDNSTGNVYWFDPTTATTSADMHYSSAFTPHNDLYNAYIDEPKRKIYFVGGDSGGLIVYDIATDTATTVAFGTNGAYTRISLNVDATNNKIYCNDGSTNIVIIDRTTYTVSNTIPVAGITSPQHFYTSGYGLVFAHGKIYVSNADNGSIGTIGVYNADFSVHYTEIVLPGAALWAGGNNHYWQNISYDPTSDKMMVCDIGSSKRHMVDLTSNTVSSTFQFVNREGKNNVEVYWKINPITNELLMMYSASNGLSDGGSIRRMYIEDRATNTFNKMYEGQYYSSLVQIIGTNQLVGCAPGQPAWGGAPGYNTDGTVTIISSSISGSNSGIKITTTLKQVDHNNSDAPTGLIKNNVVGDADYVAPTTDTSTCAVTYNTDCPADVASTFAAGVLNYEFSIPNSVKNNTAIAKIQVYAYNTNTASVEGAPIEINAAFTTNYYSGSFSGLGGLNYTIQIRYLATGGAMLQTC